MPSMRRIALTLAVLALPLFAFQAPPKKDTTKPATKPAATKPAATKGTTPGKAAAEPAESVPAGAPAADRVYVVPLKGTWGFFISPQLMNRLVDDIEARKPDVVLWVLNSADVKEAFYKKMRADELIGVHDENGWKPVLPRIGAGLRGTKQIMFVEETWGFSTLLALAFPTMYMKPDASLDGLIRVSEGWNVQDEEVVAKFRESAEAQATAFAMQGGYSVEDGANRKQMTQAMMRKELKLSAEWAGRVLRWRQDSEGPYQIDDSTERCARFPAFVAVELGLSVGVAEEIDEVLFLEGIRRYTVIPSDGNPDVGAGEALVASFNAAWNRNYDEAERLFDEVQLKQSRDPEKIELYKRNFERIVDILEKDPLATLKWNFKKRPDIRSLKNQIRDWEEQLRARSKSKRSGQGSGGGGSGGRGFGSTGSGGL
jgi:hypothetical protein